MPTTEITPTGSDTALGDWYVNRIVVDRKPLLLLVSSTSLLPILLPARDVRSLPDRLASIVESRLRRLGLSDEVIDAEKRAMTPVVIGPTIDRSVTGIVVEFARAVGYHLEPGQWDESALLWVEKKLEVTPCHASRPFDQVIFPDKKTPELLRAKWLGDQ